MAKKIPSILRKLISNPRRLFLADCVGAFLTALLLGTVLTRLEEDFGMPRKVLYPLSALACVYAIYSFCCYWFAGRKWRPFLMVIAVANLIYCCITIALVVLFYHALTVLGVIYFVSEILIIIGLVYIEALAISESNNMHLPRVTSKP